MLELNNVTIDGGCTVVCEHLIEIEKAIIRSGAKEIRRGQVWSRNCREWVYFDCLLNVQGILNRFQTSDCVSVHTNDDQKSGRELGLVCNTCHDALVGLHPEDRNGQSEYPGEEN